VSDNPQLEKLTIHCYNKYLDLKLLTTYCKDLKFFCLMAHPDFGKNQLDEIKKCIKLEFLVLEMCKGTLKIGNLRHFFLLRKNLKFFSLLSNFKESGNGFSSIPDDTLEKLYREFPKIQRITS